MHNKYYLLLDTVNTGASIVRDVTFGLNRHIPNGAKMRMLQFNWNTGSSQYANSNQGNGLVLHLQNVGNQSDFYNTTSGAFSTCILAQIPQESLFVPASTTTAKTEGTYEPYNPCVVKISAPITSVTIVLKDGIGSDPDDSDLANLDYSVLLEIDESEC